MSLNQEWPSPHLFVFSRRWLMSVWETNNQLSFFPSFFLSFCLSFSPPSLGRCYEYLASPPGPLFFRFVLFFGHSAFTPSGPLMLLPGCWWTKEPPSAGFKDGVVGGWGWIKNQSNKEWVLEAEDSTWNCEPCTPVKHGLGVHSCHCFSFFFWPRSPLCYMSLSPDVCLRLCLFTPLLALYVLVLQVNQWGNKSYILSPCSQVKTKATCWCCT